jgi:RHS repeat-associated protein
LNTCFGAGRVPGETLKSCVNWYDYGSRFYASDLGRWTTSDNSSENYYPTSVYVYSFNNPIRFVDPDGNDPDDVVNRAYSYSGTIYEYGGKNPHVSAIGMANSSSSIFLSHMRNDITEPIFNAVKSGNYSSINAIYRDNGYGDLIGNNSIGIDCSGVAGESFNSDPDKLMNNFDLSSQNATSMAKMFESGGKEGAGSTGLLHNNFSSVGKGDLVFSGVSTDKNGNVTNASHVMVATGNVKRDKGGSVIKVEVVSASYSAGKVKTQTWKVNDSSMRVGHTFRTTDTYKTGPVLDAEDKLKMSNFVEKYQY